MACKHEGGIDLCVRDKYRHCFIDRSYRKQSDAKQYEYCTSGRGWKMLVGASAEHLVTADLIARGFHVWAPQFEGGKHDRYFEAESRGWTIQVKVAKRHRRTGALTHNASSRSGRITSDILALVWPPTKRIEYRAMTPAGLPRELDRGTSVPETRG